MPVDHGWDRGSDFDGCILWVNERVDGVRQKPRRLSGCCLGLLLEESLRRQQRCDPAAGKSCARRRPHLGKPCPRQVRERLVYHALDGSGFSGDRRQRSGAGNLLCQPVANTADLLGRDRTRIISNFGTARRSRPSGKQGSAATRPPRREPSARSPRASDKASRPADDRRLPPGDGNVNPAWVGVPGWPSTRRLQELLRASPCRRYMRIAF